MPWFEIFKVLAVIAAVWIIFGIAAISCIPEGQWAGIPRWKAILIWPAAFCGN